MPKIINTGQCRIKLLKNNTGTFFGDTVKMVIFCFECANTTQLLQ